MYHVIRLLMYAGAMVARRHPAICGIWAIVPFLAVMAVSVDAGARTGYCVQKVGEDERGIRVRLDGTAGCDLFQAVRQFPHGAKEGTSLSRQEQLRSIWAANLAVEANGAVSQPAVKRSCTERTPKREPGTSDEENRACERTGGQAFYYALPDAVFLVPRGRALTPVERGEQKKAEAAEQARRENEKAAAAERAREESEAFKQVREMRKRVDEANARADQAEQRVAWVADKEWRAKALPAAVGLLALAAAWGLLMTLAASALRFKYRAVTVDNYGYPNPLEAAKDLLMKLASAREEMALAKRESDAARLRDADRIAKLESEAAGFRSELNAALALNTALRQENERHKRTVEVMLAPRSVGPGQRDRAVEVLSERNADLDARYNELEERHRDLQVETTALKLSYKELEGDLASVTQVRDRQARMLMAASADRISLEEQAQALQGRLDEQQQEIGRLQAMVDEYKDSWTSVLRASNRPPALEAPIPAETLNLDPEAIRGRTLPAAAVPAPQAVDYPQVTTAQAEPEEIFASLFQELTDARLILDVYARGFRRLEGVLSWDLADESPEPEVIRVRVDHLVDEVCGMIRGLNGGSASCGKDLPPSDAPLPNTTQSDVVRIAKMARLLDGAGVDPDALRRQLVDADPLAVADCLKVCVHEWALRCDRETMAYAVMEPHELYDLNRLLCSQLVCGPDISVMVPEGFAEAVDRVHLAYAPAFSRRAVMRSVPPPAAPQAAG